MAMIQSDQLQQLTGLVGSIARDLGPHALATLIAHPEAVRSALAATASVLADWPAAEREPEVIEAPPPTLMDALEARRRLDARTDAGQEEEWLTSDEMARRLNLKTRQTVLHWLDKGRLVGWQGARRGYVFPAGQLDERHQPPAGLERITLLLGDGYSVWIWLTTPLNALEGDTPLERLHRGEVDLVVAAAQGDAQGDFA